MSFCYEYVSINSVLILMLYLCHILVIKRVYEVLCDLADSAKMET